MSDIEFCDERRWSLVKKRSSNLERERDARAFAIRHPSPSTATMESFHYARFPPHLSDVHIALFTSVQNAPELRRRIVNASTMSGKEGDAERERVNFAFVDARLVR